MPLSRDQFYIDSQFQDFYQILGVSKNATQGEINKAYRKKALEFHPDKNPQPSAAEEFKKISRAKEVLSDPDLRNEYNLAHEQNLSQAKYFSGKSQSNYQFTQKSRDQSNQWQSYQSPKKPGDQSNQWQSYYKSNQRQFNDKFNQNQYDYRYNQQQSHDRFHQDQYDHQYSQNKDDQNQSYYSSEKTNEFRQKIDDYEDKIRKINNYINNLSKDRRELLRLQYQTRSQLDIVKHQNNWVAVVNQLKHLSDLQQQEQTTTFKILRSQEDLVALKTEEYTLVQEYFSRADLKSFFRAELDACQQQLRSLQIQNSEIKQKIELQQQINANNNQTLQTKIGQAQILVEMQASAIIIEDEIAITVQQKNTAMQAKRKTMQEHMHAQRTARQYWNQGDIDKAIIAERNSMQLFINENQQLLSQSTAELREAELQQAKLKCLVEIAKYKNLLSPNKALQNEYENKKILMRLWQEKVKQYNNKVATQEAEYKASIAIKAKVSLIEDLQKTRIAIKKSQEQLLINRNILGVNQSSLRNKALQDYQRLSQWLEHKYLNKNFWSKPYDEIKAALEEIKDSANNIQKEIAASKPEVTKPQVVNKPVFTKVQPATKPVPSKPQSTSKPVVPTAANKPVVTKSQSTTSSGAFKPQPATKPVASKSNLGFSSSAVKVTGMANKVQTPKVQTPKVEQPTKMQTPKVQPVKMQQPAKTQSTTKPVAPKQQLRTKPVIPTVNKPVAPKSNLGFSNDAAKFSGSVKSTSVKTKPNQDPQVKPRWR